MYKKKWLQRVHPKITQNHANQRLAWANQYAHYTLDNWKHVKWSNKCSIKQGKGIKLVWTFQTLSEQLYMHNIEAKRTGKSVLKMFWAGFGYNVCTELVPLDGDLDSRRGEVTAQVIYDLY
jgi:hypothetical protein